ncbi:hypothetical protein [Nostoc sp. FACHB-152]|nr:hypothetical protein [Nostoc sp. FACHB-152]
MSKIEVLPTLSKPKNFFKAQPLKIWVFFRLGIHRLAVEQKTLP